MSGDLPGRYGLGAASAADSSAFNETLISELRATGALAQASEEKTTSPESAPTDETASSSKPTTRSNFYDFTTTEWQNRHPGCVEIFTSLPGLAAFMGDNPVYGSMFVNDGRAGAQAAINAYLRSLS